MTTARTRRIRRRPPLPHPRRARAVPSAAGAGTLVPVRYRSAPPAQDRSRASMDRFAEAVESLLLTRTFEEISVQQIVRRARRSIGAFYTRFGSKDALLPLLYQRYHDRLEATLRAGLARTNWEALDLPRTIEAVVDYFLETFERERGLLRTLTLFARMRPEALPADIEPQRRRIYESLFRVFDRHRDRIAHASADEAVRFAVYMVSSITREKTLFDRAPQARITPMTRDALRAELSRAIHSYLPREGPR